MTRDIDQSPERAPRQKDRDLGEAHVIKRVSGESASECASRAKSHQVASVEALVGADSSDQLGGQIQHAEWLNHLDVSPITTISGSSCDDDERLTLWNLYERLQSRDSE
jgi:hypothetical protein